MLLLQVTHRNCCCLSRNRQSRYPINTPKIPVFPHNKLLNRPQIRTRKWLPQTPHIISCLNTIKNSMYLSIDTKTTYPKTTLTVITEWIIKRTQIGFTFIAVVDSTRVAIRSLYNMISLYVFHGGCNKNVQWARFADKWKSCWSDTSKDGNAHANNRKDKLGACGWFNGIKRASSTSEILDVAHGCRWF